VLVPATNVCEYFFKIAFIFPCRALGVTHGSSAIVLVRFVVKIP
jgi:hypothetical protein